MNKRSVLCALMAGAMMLGLAACSEGGSSSSVDVSSEIGSDVPAVTESNTVTESPAMTEVPADSSAAVTETSEPAPKTDLIRAEYRLPEGAASEYELYKTVTGFLNNGFKYSELGSVYDPILTLAYYSKWESSPDSIFTYGLDQKASCELINNIVVNAAEMSAFNEEDGEASGSDEDDGGNDEFDYSVFKPLFPESIQAKINDNEDSYRSFIKIAVSTVSSKLTDGRSPFSTDQTEWEVLGEDKIEKKEYHSNDWDEDLYTNFPKTYSVGLGKYDYEGDVYEMNYKYTQIGGRFYLLGFDYIM